jgi:hypothetical protein
LGNQRYEPIIFMSRAFVKESEGEWLGDVAPDVAALERFLTREAGVRVDQLRSFVDADNRTVHEMSNGSCYTLDEDQRWRTV